MATCTTAISRLQNLLGEDAAREIYRLAKKQDALEAHWRNRAQALIESLTRKVARNLEHGLAPFHGIDLEDEFIELLMAQSVGVMEAGARSAQHATPSQATSSALARPPRGRVPRSLRDIRELWDKYRKRGFVPARQRDLAERVSKAYRKRVQGVFERYSAEFRGGDIVGLERAREALRKQADISYRRAKMTIETETTYYYNKVRREIYDTSPDVTHYLFVAVRDHATTKWCKTRTGLVYAKGDPLLEAETPPCHWNCRSEMLPLTPQNPKHLRLIQNKAIQRRNNRCAPLPPGWTGRSAA